MRYETFVEAHLQVKSSNGAETNCLCPLPEHTEHNPSFRFNMRSGLWMCNGCGAKGNIHQLASRIGVDVIDTGVSLEDLRRRIEAPMRRVNGSAPEDHSRYSESYLDRFIQHPYWSVERHLSARTINAFQLTYDPNSDRVVIPLRNSHGQLLGVIYRRLDDGKPKYLNPRDFSRSRTLFGAHMVRAGKHRRIAIVEGPVDALAMWDVEIPAVALFGASMTEGQVSVLKTLNVNMVVVMTDNDEAGRKAGVQIKKILRGTGIIVRVAAYTKRVKDVAEMSSEDRLHMFEIAAKVRTSVHV